MTGRQLALAVAAAGVLVMGVYLFFAVRSTPSPERASEPVPAAAPAPEVHHPAMTQGLARAVAKVGNVWHPPAHARAGRPAARPAVAPEPYKARPALVGPRPGRPNPKLDAIMDQANKAYDHQDYDRAMDIARSVLRLHPHNVRMLRIMVSASCIAGDPAVGKTYYDRLPAPDRRQMQIRCNKYGVTYTDSGQ